MSTHNFYNALYNNFILSNYLYQQSYLHHLLVLAAPCRHKTRRGGQKRNHALEELCVYLYCTCIEKLPSTPQCRPVVSLATSSLLFMLKAQRHVSKVLTSNGLGLKEYYAAAGGFRSLILVVIKRLLKVSKNVLGINFG